MNRELIYNTLFDVLVTYLTVIPILNEPTTISANPYVTVWNQRFVSDVSVVTDTGTVFTNVSPNPPAQGQYSVSNGIYTFNLSDLGKAVLITYDFTGIITASKRLRAWGDVNVTDQPAMFLTMNNQSNEKVRGIKSKWTLLFDLYIYVNTTNDPNVIPASLMNPILDQVDSMFNPDNLADYALTLGGLVSHAAINGTVITDEGLLDDQAVVVIPIEILVPT